MEGPRFPKKGRKRVHWFFEGERGFKGKGPLEGVDRAVERNGEDIVIRIEKKAWEKGKSF